MKALTQALALAGATALLVLSACGGGGGSAGSSTTSVSTPSGASPGAMSSGAISAFGSIFVNGHEFGLAAAKVIDDDTGTTTTDVSGLEVGTSVDVRAGANSSDASPEADEVHLHPLVRGVVDGSDVTTGTLTVMGQAVQVTASTNFSDHRACLTASSSPCTPVTGQSGLVATTGAGSSAVAGSYVTVHGYLFSSSSGSANVVATLVSVADAPSAAKTAAYKVEGVVTAVASSTLTIGGLSVDLGSATCYVSGAGTACAGAFSTGQVVSAIAGSAPALPATSFGASVARLRTKLVVETAGAAVELEGKVSSVTTSPAAFVLRGIGIDASALASLPAVGDFVELKGTVASGGTSVTASSVKVLHAAVSATVGFEGDAAGVVSASSANTYTLTLLGESITVDSNTRLADRSQHGSGSPSSNPFNITTFQTYLAASASQHLLVRAQADASGNLSAMSLTIVPASSWSGVGGTVDATPAPVNGSSSTTPTTFSVHGLAVSADPASIVKQVHLPEGHGFGGMSVSVGTATIAAGDFVMVRGTFASGTLTVAAQGSGHHDGNFVIDYGAVPSGGDHDDF